MNKVFTSNGWEDYIYWQTEDKKTLKKINTLLKDIDRNGNEGIGKPEGDAVKIVSAHQGGKGEFREPGQVPLFRIGALGPQGDQEGNHRQYSQGHKKGHGEFGSGPICHFSQFFHHTYLLFTMVLPLTGDSVSQGSNFIHHIRNVPINK